jgi:hypothetical protein
MNEQNEVTGAEPIEVDRAALEAEAREEQRAEREGVLERVSAALAWFAEHPDVPLPLEFTMYGKASQPWSVFCATKEDAVALARAVPRLDKEEADHLGAMRYRAVLDPDTDAAIQLFVDREQVCRAEVVGKKTIKVQVDQFEEVEVDDVRWHCEPLLAGEEAGE